MRCYYRSGWWSEGTINSYLGSPNQPSLFDPDPLYHLPVLDDKEWNISSIQEQPSILL